MKIELWDHSFFVGLIVPQKTGVLWTNQTGAEACQHPELEGLFVPVWSTDLNHEYPKNCFIGVWPPGKEIEKWSVVRPDIHRFLVQTDLKDIFTFPDEDWWESNPEIIKDFAEAWVPVKIKKKMPNAYRYPEMVVPLAGTHGILTYGNSD